MSTNLPTTRFDAGLPGRRDVRIFLCYRRNDGAWHAEWLDRQLDNLEYNDADGTSRRLHVYYDKNAPGVADWKALHFPSLQTSQALILICTPGIAKDLSRRGQPDWVYEELSWWTKNRQAAPIVIDATGEGDRWLPDMIASRWPDINRLDVRREDAEGAARDGNPGFADRIRRRIIGSIQQSERASVFEDLERSRKLTTRLKAALLGTVALLVVAMTAGLMAWQFSRIAEGNAEEARQRLYFSQIGLAQANYYGNNVGRTRELLESSPNDLRHWEWKYLWRRLHQATVNIPIDGSHAGSVVFSRDGQLIASGGDTVKVWKAETGEEFLSLPGKASKVAFSPVRDLIALAGESATTLWDMTGKSLLTIPRGASALAFSPDGREIVLADRNTIDMWGTEAGGRLMTFMTFGGIGKHIYSVAGGSRRRVAAAVGVGNGGRISLWNTTEPTRPLRLGMDEEESGEYLTFSPDGSRLASGGGRVIKLWDVDSASNILTIHNAGEFVRAVAFSPNGRLLASSSSDATIQIWDALTGANLKTIRGHEHEVLGLAFSPDGSKLASSSWDGTIKIWSVLASVEAQTLRGHTGVVNSVTVSSDGSYIASVGYDGTVRLWETQSGKQLRVLLNNRDFGIGNVAFSPAPKSTALAAALQDQIRIWDVKTGVEHTIPGPQGRLNIVVLSPDGRHAASGTLNGIITYWDVTARTAVLTRRWEKHGPYGIRSVAFSPDGTRLAVSGDGTLIRIWDLKTGEEKVTLSGHGPSLIFGAGSVASVSYSPDGTLIVSGGDDGVVKLWDAQGGLELKTFRGHQAEVSSVAFSPDGKRIVSGSHDTKIKLWDTHSGLEVMTLNGHTYQVLSVRFTPDGEHIISGSTDSTVKVW